MEISSIDKTIAISLYEVISDIEKDLNRKGFRGIGGGNTEDIYTKRIKVSKEQYTDINYTIWMIEREPVDARIVVSGMGVLDLNDIMAMNDVLKNVAYSLDAVVDYEKETFYFGTLDISESRLGRAVILKNKLHNMLFKEEVNALLGC